jgi:hypothetical protein
MNRLLSLAIGAVVGSIGYITFAPASPITTTEFSWLSVTQTVIAGALVAGVLFLFHFGRVVGRWYVSNEERMKELEEARRKHRYEIDGAVMRLDEVEDHLGDTDPEFRRRIRQLIRDGKLPDRRVSDKR